MIYSLSREYYNRGKRAVRYADTIADYEAAIRIDPGNTWAYYELAWLRAVCPAAEFRDSAKAVEAATRACKLTNWQDHEYVSILAVAYSEAGDFGAAIKWQKEAIDLLPEAERNNREANYEARLKLYQSAKPYHEGSLWSFSTGELVAWWKLDQSQDGEVPDSSGNGFNGKLMGDASIVTDTERGKVLSLDGEGDYVAIDNSTFLDITDSITVAVWIKVKAFNKLWQAIVTKGDKAWRLQRYTGDTLEFACTGIDVKGTTWGHVLGRVDVKDGQWHHVAGVYNGNEICIYVDGILDVFAKGSGSINTNSFPILIGENAETSTPRGWNGMIDDVRIYSYALSKAEVKELYAGRGPGPNEKPE